MPKPYIPYWGESIQSIANNPKFPNPAIADRLTKWQRRYYDQNVVAAAAEAGEKQTAAGTKELLGEFSRSCFRPQLTFQKRC